MATALSRATDTARKAIIVFIVFAIFTFIFQFISDSLRNIPVGPIITGKTSPYVSANSALNLIPRPEVTSLTLAEGTKASFSLAATGKLPLLPEVINIFEITEPHEDFGSALSGTNTALRLGFKQEDEKERLADDILFWQNNTKTRSMQYNKVDQEWNFQAVYGRDPATTTLQRLESKEYYLSKAPSLISQLSLANSYFASAKSRVDFINVSSQAKFTMELNPGKARYARVALYKRVESATLNANYRPGPTETPVTAIFSEVRKYNYLNGPSNFVVQGKAEKPEVDTLSFDFKDYRYGAMGVYPVITPEEAWNNIQNNKGYLYWIRKEGQDIFVVTEQLKVLKFDVDTTTVRTIYIEPDQWEQNKPWTHFLQPFYIFEGVATLEGGTKAEFAFIIEALKNESYLAPSQ